MTLSENEDDIKNACTITWEEKQGTYAPIFDFPVALLNREEHLPAKSQPGKKTVKPIYAEENVVGVLFKFIININIIIQYLIEKVL